MEDFGGTLRFRKEGEPVDRDLESASFDEESTESEIELTMEYRNRELECNPLLQLADSFHQAPFQREKDARKVD